MARSVNGGRVIAAAALAASTLVAPCVVHGQEIEIGIIDLYGLSRVSEGQVRQALTFAEGDTIAIATPERPALLRESEDRLARLPDVARARTRLVCCDQGRAIVYVGIEERDAAILRFRAEPRGDVRLAADIVRAGDEFAEALRRAVLRGDAGEERSLGHSLADDPGGSRLAVRADRGVNARIDGVSARLEVPASPNLQARIVPAHQPTRSRMKPGRPPRRCPRSRAPRTAAASAPVTRAR